jgi:GNAT superfamily N-acetyltransferase
MPQQPATSWSIKSLSPSNIHLFPEHLLRLEIECRRSRFGSAASDRLVLDYAARIDCSSTTVLACFIDGQMRGAAELKSLDATWCARAEAAFSVERPWQGYGLGTALMSHIIATARQRAVEHIYLSCHLSNRRIQRMAERVGASLKFEDCECFADIQVGHEHSAPVLGAASQSPVITDD